MEPERKLARIRSATLGFEDHGILTSFLNLEYAEPGRRIGSTGQGFGGYGLGGEYASRWIEGVLTAVGVTDWADLPGKMVWADAEHVKVHRIVGLDTGKEFDPTLWSEEYRQKEKQK